MFLTEVVDEHAIDPRTVEDSVYRVCKEQDSYLYDPCP